MRCLERKTTERHWEMPLPDFLERCSLVQRFAANQNMTVEEMLVDGIIANRLEGEGYESWLARQVREVLSLQCEQDNWRPGADGHTTCRTDRDLEQVSFSTEDRRWIVATLGQRADVLAVWVAVQELRPIALAA